MRTSELRERMRQALTRNDALAAWSLRHFNRTMTLLDVYDPHDPPSDDACPFVSFELLSHGRGNDTARQSWEFLVIVEVRLPEGVSGEDLAADLRELVEDCLLRPGIGKVKTGEDVHEVHEGTYWQNISTVSITR